MFNLRRRTIHTTKNATRVASPKLSVELLEDRTVPSSIHEYNPILGTLPDSQGFTRVQGGRSTTHAPEPTINAGVMHQSPVSGDHVQYWYKDQVPLDFSTGSYVLEADLRVVSSNYIANIGTGQRSGYYLWAVDSAGRNFAVGIASNGITINTDSLFAPSNGARFTPFNTTGFHQYRLVISDRTATLFIDGNAFVSVALGGTVRPDVRNRVIFGDASGAGVSETELRSFRFGPPTVDINMQSAQLDGRTVRFNYETTGNPGPFKVGLYRSTDGITYNPADLIDTQTVMPSPTNPQVPGTFLLPSPWNPTRSKPYLVVVADPPTPGKPQGEIKESNDTDPTPYSNGNNATSLHMPDIVITSTKTTNSHGVTIEYTVTHSKIIGSIQFAVYRSADEIFGKGDHQVGSTISLGPTQLDLDGKPVTEVGLHRVTIPTQLTIDLQHPFVLSIADPNQLIAEIQEDNNTGQFRKYAIAVVTHGLQLNGSLPPWTSVMGARLRSMKFNDVVVLNWANLSRIQTTGQTQRAADYLTNIISQRTSRLARLPTDAIDILFLGHSRGAVVNSLAADKLQVSAGAALRAGWVKMVMLDPHPANNNHGPLLSRANSLRGMKFEQEIINFRQDTQDPDIAIASNVDEGVIYYQQTHWRDAVSFPTRLFFPVNLWGLPTVSNPHNVLLNTIHLKGLGHSDIYEWYYFNVLGLGTY